MIFSLVILSVALLLRPLSIFDKSESVSGENPSNATNEKSSPTVISAEDVKIYDRLAEEMIFYHTMLRSTWDKLYRGTEPGATEPPPATLIGLGLHFCAHLQTHHDIEEAYWFPRLGEKMEGFRPGHFASEQHKEMHKGLEILRPHLEECRRGQRVLDRGQVRQILDSFGGVLWQHMDDEVSELRAENMIKYWSRDEMHHLLR